VLTTGDELVDVDEELTEGKIRNSNTYALCAQIEKCGAVPINKGIVKDDILEIEKRIKECLDCDIILTSGGVSAGDFDFVKVVIEEKLKADIKFWKVAMKPGKPVLFGLIEGKPIFGLPGNTVSSMVNVEIFVKPAVFKMLGCNKDPFLEADAVLDEDIKIRNKRKNFIRAVTKWEDGRYLTKSTGSQGSGILKSMVLANSLIILPEETACVKKGKNVKVRLIC
jgi:molybdopterin molybdotransferase